MGMFSEMPPSTSSRPSRSTGANTPGADRLARIARRQIAGFHDHRLTGLQIRRDRAKRGGQVVEARDARDRERQAPQHLVELLPLNQALRELDVAASKAQRKFDQEILILLLAAERQILARRAVAERVLPVQRSHDRLDLARAEPARIQAADDGAHARAGDRINGDVELLENLEHADVRGTPRAPAGENEPDARPVRRGSRRGGTLPLCGRFRPLASHLRADRRGHPTRGVLGICAAHDREPQGRDEESEDPARGPDRPC